MPLAQEPSPVERDPRKLMTLIYGEAGVGKTSFASQIPGHYFIDCEVGTKGIAAYRSTCASWKEFLELGSELITAKQANWNVGGKQLRPIEAIIIDVYERLWHYAAEHVLATETFKGERNQRMKFDKLDEVSFGAAHARTNQLVISKLNALKANGFGLFILSHVKTKIFKWKGQDLTKFMPGLSQSGVDAIVNECDAVGYFFVNERYEHKDGQVVQVEDSRAILWQPRFLYEAKHRLDMPATVVVPKGKGWQSYCEEYEKAYQARLNELEGGAGT